MDLWGAQWMLHDPLRMNGVLGWNARDIVPLYAVQGWPPRSTTEGPHDVQQGDITAISTDRPMVQRRFHSTGGRDQMRLSRAVMAWLPLVLLTACVASHPGEHQAGTLRPAVDRLLNRGDIQVAQTHLRAFGFDPGPIDGIYTAQTQAAVRAYQARYGLPVSGELDYATRIELLPGLDFQHSAR